MDQPDNNCQMTALGRMQEGLALTPLFYSVPAIEKTQGKATLMCRLCGSLKGIL